MSWLSPCTSSASSPIDRTPAARRSVESDVSRNARSPMRSRLSGKSTRTSCRFPRNASRPTENTPSGSSTARTRAWRLNASSATAWVPGRTR
ncbi:MAG: hypothetical protein V8S24_14425 [Gordonibacter pamelaeae]